MKPQEFIVDANNKIKGIKFIKQRYLNLAGDKTAESEVSLDTDILVKAIGFRCMP